MFNYRTGIDHTNFKIGTPVIVRRDIDVFTVGEITEIKRDEKDKDYCLVTVQTHIIDGFKGASEEILCYWRHIFAAAPLPMERTPHPVAKNRTQGLCGGEKGASDVR